MDITPVPLNVETVLAACRGDPALACTLVAQYRASLTDERAALARAVAAAPPDWADVGRRAHRLQSGGAYLSIERIAAAAGDLEAGVAAGAAPDALTAAGQVLDRAIDAFLAVSGEDWARRLRGGPAGDSMRSSARRDARRGCVSRPLNPRRRTAPCPPRISQAACWSSRIARSSIAC